MKSAPSPCTDRLWICRGIFVIREYGTSWQFIIFFRTHCMPSGEFSCVEWEAVELLSFPLAPKPQSILQWAVRNIIGLSKGEKNETSTHI